MRIFEGILISATLGLAVPALAKPAAPRPAHMAVKPAAAAPAAKPAAATPAAATPAAATPAAATPVAAPAAAQHMTGTIVSASAKDHALTLMASDGEHQLAVALKAAIKLQGKAVGLGDLKAGQKIDATVAKVKGKETVESAVITP